MYKEIQDKVKSCKALQTMTIGELLATQRFRDNLAAYITAQRTDREQIRKSYEAMRKLGGAKGYKLPSHPIDKCINLTVDQFVEEYKNIVEKHSPRPRSEREYIRQLCAQAYNLTVAQYVVDEFPELADVLIPKNNKDS